MFAPEIYTRRVRRVQEIAQAQGVDAVILTPGPDFAYLIGSWMDSHERLSALVIPSSGEIRAVLPATDLLKVGYLNQWGIALEGWKDGQDPHTLALEGIRAEKIAVSGSMTANHLLRFQELSGAQFLPADLLLAELFTRKDKDEISQLRECAHAIDAVHDQVPDLLQAGRTEAEVAADIEALILEKHSSVDFIIVGSGPNGANPHHSFSQRVLNLGEPVVVDLGGTYGAGYHSDCTRTYIVGGPAHASQEVVDAYGVLYEAQKAARLKAAPGVLAQEVDSAAREVIENAGYGANFTHRTGHGIGLSTHEEPFIMQGNDLHLEEGMAFSIEPGIYLEGQWGMRLEDIVVTTANGIESLNQGPRELR